MTATQPSARRAAVSIVRTLRDAGHVAYLAGGCVRDALLGMTPKDYDVATDARPQHVRRLFRHSRYVGEAFGVALVRVRDDQPTTGNRRPPIHQVEVATFRTEWGYEDGRRPSHVEFSDAEHDARRRDFTINGLFEDPLARAEKDRIIDYVGGVADLKAGVVRAIGDPDERFAEDYLRLLRAVRFAARLNFKIDRATAGAIKKHAPMLAKISRERIGQEVQATLTGPRPVLGARLMQRFALDGPVLDEPLQQVKLPTLSRLTRGRGADYPTLLAAWLIDRRPPADLADARDVMKAVDGLVQSSASIISRWRRALCLTNEHRDALRDVLTAVRRTLGWPTLTRAQRKRLLARPCWPQTQRLLGALRHLPGISELVGQIEADVKPLYRQGVAPPPLVTGDDLIADGFEPGPKLGKLLDDVYDAQLEGDLTTREQALRWVRQRR